MMPMFPLGTVLFPHMPLTLRIFEERYLKLLGDMMEAEDPEFGVVLIERGQEVGGGEKRFSLGTTARVSQIGSSEDFLGLVAAGGQRFRVTEWMAEFPYPQANVEFLPDLEWDDQHEPLRAEVEVQVRRLLSFASEFGNLPWDATIALSDDPVASAWQIAGILPVGQLDQIDLLKAESVHELLTATLNLAVEADQILRNSLLNQAEDDAHEITSDDEFE
ncbi:LON peptidase substrate-binding domain-containing protein [Alpinimonas psychrophila]|nr:LON peptidase substrate-binding domain-containing protein [Alpinimonas psychrophila]